jgi:hypothetical protein
VSCSGRWVASPRQHSRLYICETVDKIAGSEGIQSIMIAPRDQLFRRGGDGPSSAFGARVVSGPEHSRLHRREVTGETARGGASLTPKPGWTALARCKCLGRGLGWRVVQRACTLSSPNRPAWGRTRSPFRRLDSTAAQYDRRDRGTENRRRPGRRQWTPNDATAK